MTSRMILAAAPHLRSCAGRLLHKRQLATAAAVAMLRRGEGGRVCEELHGNVTKVHAARRRPMRAMARTVRVNVLRACSRREAACFGGMRLNS
jgi:hypothetical protein